MSESVSIVIHVTCEGNELNVNMQNMGPGHDLQSGTCDMRLRHRAMELQTCYTRARMMDWEIVLRWAGVTDDLISVYGSKNIFIAPCKNILLMALVPLSHHQQCFARNIMKSETGQTRPFIISLGLNQKKFAAHNPLKVHINCVGQKPW